MLVRKFWYILHRYSHERKTNWSYNVKYCLFVYLFFSSLFVRRGEKRICISSIKETWLGVSMKLDRTKTIEGLNILYLVWQKKLRRTEEWKEPNWTSKSIVVKIIIFSLFICVSVYKYISKIEKGEKKWVKLRSAFSLIVSACVSCTYIIIFLPFIFL